MAGAAELVNLATNEKLKDMDWIKNIEICELVAHDQGEARDVIKAIKKRLADKSSSVLLLTVMLLEVLINNCGDHIHKQVIDMGLLPILVKIVKKKSDLPVREKIFLLLDATQTSLGGASGKFPQYHAAYYELVSAGIKFPQAPNFPPTDLPKHKDISDGKSPKHDGAAQHSGSQALPEASIIQKARAALDVLKEVLDAIDTQHPEGAKDEFTLDLVEQCSFQKQRIMHLVLTCRDEKAVSQAIQLNESLERVLARHEALISVRASSSVNHFSQEEAEEEDANQLFRRIRKGKACVKPEAEDHIEKPLGLFGSIQQERLHRPIIRSLCPEPQESNTEPAPAVVTPERPAVASSHELSSEHTPAVVAPPQHTLAVVIPPPPARHIERERFFQEKQVNSTALGDQMTSSSLPVRNTSS